MIELLKQRLKSVSESVADTVNTVMPLTYEETRNARLDICKSCEYLIHMTGQCKKCGCFMFAKTHLANASCPIGKWGTAEVKNKEDNN